MTKIYLLFPVILILLFGCNNSPESLNDPKEQPSPNPDREYYLSFVRVDKSTGERCQILAASDNTVNLNGQTLDVNEYLVYSDNEALDWNDDWTLEVNFMAFNNDDLCSEGLEPLMLRIVFKDSVPVVGKTYSVTDDRLLAVAAGFINYSLCPQHGETKAQFTLSEISADGRVSGTFSMEDDCQKIVEGRFYNIPYAEESII